MKIYEQSVSKEYSSMSQNANVDNLFLETNSMGARTFQAPFMSYKCLSDFNLSTLLLD